MTTDITTLIASIPFLIGMIVTAFIAMIVLLETEKEGWATTVFSIAIGILLWDFKEAIFGFVTSNPLQTLGFIASYVVVGVLWSMFKWKLHVKPIYDKLLSIKNQVIDKFKNFDEEAKAEFNSLINAERFENHYGYSLSFSKNDSFEKVIDKILPKASNKKSQITSWIAYWPISILGSFLNNPFRKFFEWVYEQVSGTYERITNYYKKDLLK